VTGGLEYGEAQCLDQVDEARASGIVPPNDTGELHSGTQPGRPERRDRFVERSRSSHGIVTFLRTVRLIFTHVRLDGLDLLGTRMPLVFIRVEIPDQ
jgi:hypothetical protein